MEDGTLIYIIGVICMLSVGFATALTVLTLKDEGAQEHQGPIIKGIRRILLLILLGTIIVATVVYFAIHSFGGFKTLTDYSTSMG